jgi:hypothetical protein
MGVASLFHQLLSLIPNPSLARHHATLQAGFQDAEFTPDLIVFMGNFSAGATANAADADYPALREGFSQLGRLIDTYTAIKVCSCWLLI